MRPNGCNEPIGPGTVGRREAVANEGFLMLGPGSGKFGVARIRVRILASITL